MGGAGTERLARLLRQQGEACAQLGSPLYAELLARLADDWVSGGPTASILVGHVDDPRDDLVALRLMGGVHRLVLQGLVPRLACYYPSVAGTAPPAEAWPAFKEVLSGHADYLRARLDQAPQTNEVGRAAPLIGGLLHISARQHRPLRLIEIGASAGLNLRADHFRVELSGGRGVGPRDSPVVLAAAWEGDIPPLAAAFQIVERAGCDVEPLDPTTADGRLTLTSYVWPDQLERLSRLRGALEVAAVVPVQVQRCGGADFLRRLRLEPGTTTVLWNSLMWQYVGPDEQAELSTLVDALGGSATEEAGFAHLELEPGREPRNKGTFFVRLRTWPRGEERVLGEAHPHGVPVTWL